MSKTATLGLVRPIDDINEIQGDTAGVPNEAVNLDIIDAAVAALQGTPQGTFIVATSSGAQTISGGGKLINASGFTGPVAGDVQESVPAALAASGAIAQKQGAVRLAGSAALAMTLADPTSGGPGTGDDGKRLTLVASAAHAHVITIAGGLGGGTNNTVTLGGAIGDMVELEAIAGKWFLRPSINATASHV